MFNTSQFKELIECTLNRYNLHSPSAVNLLLGTAAQESGFGTYLKQVKGPALGIFQMEPATFEWLQRKYGERYGFEKRRAGEMVWDLQFSILLARLRYMAAPQPLPPAGDVDALAAYWKKHYNTIMGKGTEEQFIRNYARYVSGGK